MKNLINKISNIYVLGDSLSDEGCISNCLSDIMNNLPVKNKIIFNTIFLKKITNFEDFSYEVTFDDNHYNNTCSDGPTAINIVAKKFNIDLTPAYEEQEIKILNTLTKTNSKEGNNFSIIGSVCNFFSLPSLNNMHEMLPNIFSTAHLSRRIMSDFTNKTSLEHQADYLIKIKKDLPTSLVFISIGGNDILNLEFILTKKITDESFRKASEFIKESNSKIKETLSKLIKAGVQNIIVSNICDLTKTPKFLEYTKKTKFMYLKLINQYNEQLKIDIAEINNLYKKNACHLFDLYKVFTDVYNKALENNMIIDEAKFKRILISSEINKNNKKIYIIIRTKEINTNKKGEYLFWDNIHPSKWTHNEVAKHLFDFIFKIKNK